MYTASAAIVVVEGAMATASATTASVPSVALCIVGDATCDVHTYTGATYVTLELLMWTRSHASYSDGLKPGEPKLLCTRTPTRCKITLTGVALMSGKLSQIHGHVLMNGTKKMECISYHCIVVHNNGNRQTRHNRNFKQISNASDMCTGSLIC